MQMRAEVKDDWSFEEPTVAEQERETLARESFARALAEQVRAAVPCAAVLIVARGPGLPTGIHVDGNERHQNREIDTVVLTEILAGASDDRIAVAMARLILGDGDVVEHTVARNRHGEVVGVVAVRTASRVSPSWVRTVLARAANSLAGWLAYEATWPPQTLLEAIEEPALAHDGGIVLVANTALARALGRDISEVIGMPVARITQRLAIARTCALVIGDRSREAMIFESYGPLGEASVLASLERVIAERYVFVRQMTRISIDRRDNTAVAARPATVDQLVSVALLDMAAMFTSSSTSNHLRCGVYREGPWVVLELAATGTLAHTPDVDHVGSVICASRTRMLGGFYLLDASQPGSRTVRISLPVEP